MPAKSGTVANHYLMRSASRSSRRHYLLIGSRLILMANIAIKFSAQRNRSVYVQSPGEWSAVTHRSAGEQMASDQSDRDEVEKYQNEWVNIFKPMKAIVIQLSSSGAVDVEVIDKTKDSVRHIIHHSLEFGISLAVSLTDTWR